MTDTRPVEVRREEWLENYPDSFTACRQKHDYPNPVPGEELLDTRLTPYADPDHPRREGRYFVEQYCRQCGRYRWKITGPRGAYHDGTRWVYKGPQGYASPAGLGLTRADYAELYWERLITKRDPRLREELADRAAERAEREAAANGDTP